MSDPETAEAVTRLVRAMEMSKKINGKVDRLLAPLELEMMDARWSPEFRSIMWEAVMLGAKERMEEAQNGQS